MKTIYFILLIPILVGAIPLYIFGFIFIFSFRINGNRKSKNAKFIQINRKIVRRI